MANDPTDSTFDYFDEEEHDVMGTLEAGEWESVPNTKARIHEASEIARATLRKDRRMNVRMSERDMRNLKIRAAEEGIPYQTLVTMVLHKYVTGQLTETR